MLRRPEGMVCVFAAWRCNRRYQLTSANTGVKDGCASVDDALLITRFSFHEMVLLKLSACLYYQLHWIHSQMMIGICKSHIMKLGGPL